MGTQFAYLITRELAKLNNEHGQNVFTPAVISCLGRLYYSIFSGLWLEYRKQILHFLNNGNTLYHYNVLPIHHCHKSVV